MDINKLKQRDKRLTSEARVKILARLIGYNQVGEPIELVYDSNGNVYEFHVGGEYIRKASAKTVLSFLEKI